MTTFVHLATMETRHYSFQGVGHTKDEARQALYAAWQEHYRQSDAEGRAAMPETFEQLEASFDINFQALQLGQGYRDGEPLPRKA